VKAGGLIIVWRLFIGLLFVSTSSPFIVARGCDLALLRQLDRVKRRPVSRRAVRHVPTEARMERFIHEQKLANYRRLIAESNLAVTKDETQHKWLLKLLEDEVTKGVTILDLRH
jgi:hypothetical protein